VIPLDAGLVKGSHGRRPGINDVDTPIFITRRKELVPAPVIDSVGVYDLILKHLREPSTPERRGT
jgi:hypothetical protein